MQNRIHSAVAGIVLGVASTAPVVAAEFADTAVVIASAPIIERVSAPRQECWNETVTTTEYRTEPAPRTERSPVGAIAGAVVGGVLGNQIGHGSGRAAATAAGAVAGAVVGDRVGNSGQRRQGESYVVAEPQSRTVQHCRTVDDWRDEVRGYDVTYRYIGRDFTVRMPFDPGPRIRLSVSVVPEDGPYRQSAIPEAAPYRQSVAPEPASTLYREPSYRR